MNAGRNSRTPADTEFVPLMQVASLLMYDTASADIKLGQFFQTTCMSRFGHDPANGITLKGDNKGSECKFWIHDLNSQNELQAMINRSLRLKHHAILKPILSSENIELYKFVTACSVYTETLMEWISNQQGKTRGDYLSDQEKDMIISLWTAIEAIWGKGCTSDAVSQCSSYVMVSQRIKILPFVIRDQKPGDLEMTLRTQLANFLRVNFSPIWRNDEFDELISLIEDPNASSMLILRHPVLLMPVERQAMYRPMCSTLLTKDQCDILNQKVPEMLDWDKLAKSDKILRSILDRNNFSHDGTGACHLGRVVSCHYTQHMREKDALWYEKLKEDTVDRWLKTNLPLVLCRRYALMCDPAFLKAGIPKNPKEGSKSSQV